MKVVVIGTGAWGINLVRNFSDLGVLAAVCEADPTRRKEIAETYGVTAYADLDSVIAADPDAVAVATPPATHYEVAGRLLQAGKHVFVEKPLTLSLKDAERLVKLAESRQRVLMVGHLLLYQPAIRWMREFIANGELGDIYSLHQERLNLGRARSVENALWSLGVHDVAVLMYLTGRTPTDIAVTGNCGLQRAIEDDVYLHMTFDSGVSAHLHVSWLWPEKRRNLTVVGQTGILVYDELSQRVTLHRKHIDQDLAIVDHGSDVVFQGSGEPLKLELEHFLACVREGATPLSDGRNGVEVVRVLQRASELLQGRQAISNPMASHGDRANE